ncbi:hypothetical protein KOR34_42730 [Posidoniimonas corsicana]|uniref:YhhN-like protein n=2 Tax=Posidoniimonas corsicana TaxID=1938618 RepID=A0A5C5V3B8_9BACT|nr:hypothetical protein KOR34_42730 [Posidoniimonas corsicana]
MWAKWRMACILACFSYSAVSAVAAGVMFRPTGRVAHALGLFLVAGLGVVDPAVGGAGAVVLRACGYAMHVLGWVFVLSLWRRLRAGG